MKIEEWKDIPDAIAEAIEDLRDQELDQRGEANEWTIRENVHHLVEANLIAASMMLTALGTNGAAFDWSWLNPNKKWMTDLGYDRAPVGPALDLLRALCRHMSALIAANAGATRRKVTLFDTPRGKRYTKTVAQILRQEIDHAEDHLGMIEKIRATTVSR